MTNIIVAYDQQRAIGFNGDMPWGNQLPGDLAMFQKLTTGNTVIMGSKTFDSLPQRVRPLPNRENIVLSHTPDLDVEGVICVSSLKAALDAATNKVFIIGGGQVFKEALPVVDTIYATEIQATFSEADTFFPEINHEEWLQYYRVHNSAHEDKYKDQYDYDFVCYKRIK